jgi:predicted phosphodiesterase
MAYTGKGQAVIAREYREKHGPDIATSKLARIMYNENRLTFDNVEHARQRLLYIEGKTSHKKVKAVSESKFFKKEARPINPYDLPKSDEAVYEPFEIKAKRVLILADVHLPYHSISALSAAFDWAKPRKPDAILLNGDILDCHHLSKWVRDPEKRKFAEELDCYAEFIGSVKKAFPKAKIYYKTGNHEERYEMFLKQKAKELAGVKEFELETIIKRRAPNVEIIGDRRVVKIGKLNIIHGHEFGGGMFSPVNPARGLFIKAKVSCMQSDRHQTSEHTETDMNGGITTTFSTGCLCELHPYYLRLNKWNQGFAEVNVEKDGSFDVLNKRIHKGKVL